MLATMLLVAFAGSSVAARARGDETGAAGGAGGAGGADAAPLVLFNNTTSHLEEAEVSHTMLDTEFKLSEMEVHPCRLACRTRASAVAADVVSLPLVALSPHRSAATNVHVPRTAECHR